jgi:hypothetical protein
MGDEGIDEVGGIEQEQHNGDANAQLLLDQGDPRLWCCGTQREVKNRGQQNPDDDQKQ